MIQLKPNAAIAYKMLGVVYSQYQEMNKAEEAYKKAINLEPKSVLFHIALGNFYYAQEKFDLAIPQYLGVISIDANHMEAHLLLGYAFTKLKKFDDADYYFHKALGKNPDDPKVLEGVNYFYRMTNQKDTMLTVKEMTENQRQ